ncbi:MAG: leucine--tRNA ligase [Clostridiales bacterium]|jgi:leucyl-tRNA synthetase|nr:leucine--tRNA ligase [Clostridiales bacterium]
MQPYEPKKIEKKWQDKWEGEKAFETRTDPARKKFYALVEFPYPSGQGLHVGHPRPYTALDIIARKRRMEGQNVLFPIGFDAFGLPTENYAIKNKVHPKTVTEENIARFTAQLKSLGYSFDWSRCVNTTDSAYYKWTQWIFIKLFEKGLAYKSEMPINWCVSCKVGLANEEVVNGVCERCGGEVVRKVKSQWLLKITEYAQRLIDDLDDVDYIEKVKLQQKNWIGRSKGSEIDFPLDGAQDALRVFTTRPDTVFGVTYMVMSPEHPLLDKYKGKISNWDEVIKYREEAAKKSDFERTELAKDKTGVRLLGLEAVNPANGGKIPVFISDYVLISYGTGAIMAVPGHDERDWDFAKKFGLPIIEVVAGGGVDEAAYTDIADGKMVNSGFLDGMSVAEAKAAASKWLREKGYGAEKINYKLRDWVFSRQRYWGEPIPIVRCEKCGYAALPEGELPLTLPEVESYTQTDDGQSPLSKIPEWVNTTCPKCGGPAQRETDTMPQWAGSSWYFLRYTDPDNAEAPASPENLKYWTPVDWYNGGMEHTTLHLLYSRFWHKFLYDIGVAPTAEPYLRRTSHGMILGENGEKMSKSRGNVVNPDEIVDEFGADTLRVYEMFIGAFELAASWSMDGVKGCRRFLERVWRLPDFMAEGGYSEDLLTKIHQTIKKVTLDYEALKFNTAIAAMMSLVNEFYKRERVTRSEFETLLALLSPVAPHISEELHELAGGRDRLYKTPWPAYDEALCEEDKVTIAVQVNGKVKAQIEIAADEGESAAEEKAFAEKAVKNAVEGKTVVKKIYVKGRIYNIVVK